MIDKIEIIVREAGDILLSYFGKALTRNMKPDASFVTEADLASEEYLVKKLTELLPEAAVWGEETGKHGNGDYCWVIDPLDGTTNFAQGLPHFCISVALTLKDEPILGVIYAPYLNEMFIASEDGATLNGKPIHVADKNNLRDSFLIACLPYPEYEDYGQMIEKICLLLKKGYGFRILGAAALDIAYVACGRGDSIAFGGLKWWDVAAGKVLIEKAGGKVMDFEGGVVDKEFRTFVAGNELLCRELLKIIED